MLILSDKKSTLYDLILLTANNPDNPFIYIKIARPSR